MVLKRIFLISLSMLMLCTAVYSADKVVSKENISSPEKDGTISKIVILPFFDFTDSGKKYLSSYITELIKKELNIDKRITVLDASDMRIKIKEAALSGIELYDVASYKKLITDLNADAVIAGRYIIHDNEIKINYYVYLPFTNKQIEGKLFEGQIDARFLASIKRFAGINANWVKLNILAGTLEQLDAKKPNIFKEWFNVVKKSKFGIIIKNKWFFSIIIIILFFFMSRSFAFFIEKIIKKITSKTSTNIDNDILLIAKKPLKWIIIFVGFDIAVMSLKLKPEIDQFLDNVFVGLIILLVTYVLANSADIIIHSWGKKIAKKIDSRIDDDLVPLFVKIAKVVIMAVGILMVLSKFQIDIAPLIASLGIAGFAIGFAVKDSLSNIIGGIVLILDSSFAVGDKVTIDGETGIIKSIGLRNTQLKTFDNEIIVFPNGDLMNKKFKNAVLPDPVIRVIVDFTVEYGADVEYVEKVVLKEIEAIKDICTDPAPAVVFIRMDDFALAFQAKLWVPNYGDQYSKTLEATKIVYNTLNREKIGIPFPTQTVFLEKDGE